MLIVCLIGVVDELQAVGSEEALHLLWLEHVGIDGGIDSALGVAGDLICGLSGL